MNIEAQLDASFGEEGIHRTHQADDLVPDAPQVLASCLDDLYQTDPIMLLLCSLPYILFRVHILVLQSKH